MTYENEALLEKGKGRDYTVCVPRKTIETEWKIARIDRNIRPEQEHAVNELIRFLYTPVASVRSARFLGTHLRVEAETAEGYLLVALLLRSHPMAAAIGAGDAVSVRAVRGIVLPDPLGKRDPEYYL